MGQERAVVRPLSQLCGQGSQDMEFQGKIQQKGMNNRLPLDRYSGVIMSAMASQISGISIVYSTVCSGADQRKHQSPVSLAFVRGIHCFPTQRASNAENGPFDDVIMINSLRRNDPKHPVSLFQCIFCENIINSLWLNDALWWYKMWVKVGSGNGSLPDGTKPLPEPLLWVIIYKCPCHSFEGIIVRRYEVTSR